MITNIHRNRMGTTSFDGLFPGMRKVQDFIVYPMKQQDVTTRAIIQSDTRIGRILLECGTVYMSKPHTGGAYFVHLSAEGREVGKLNAEELLLLKAAIFGSAHGHAGTNGIVYTDNSAALEVFGGQS